MTNMLQMGREARLQPNIHYSVELPEYTTDECIAQWKERLDTIRERLRRTKGLREIADVERIYQPGDKVWLKSYFKSKGKGAKLQPKFIDRYRVLRVFPYQVYEVEKRDRKTLQHEKRLRKKERYQPKKKSTIQKRTTYRKRGYTSSRGVRGRWLHRNHRTTLTTRTTTPKDTRSTTTRGGIRGQWRGLLLNLLSSSLNSSGPSQSFFFLMLCRLCAWWLSWAVLGGCQHPGG